MATSFERQSQNPFAPLYPAQSPVPRSAAARGARGADKGSIPPSGCSHQPGPVSFEFLPSSPGASPTILAPSSLRGGERFAVGWDTVPAGGNVRFIDLAHFGGAPAPAPVLMPRPAPASHAARSNGFAGLARFALTVALAAGSVAYLRAQKQVTIVDGAQTLTLKTFAPDVKAALARSGVKVGSQDRVLPGPGARLGSASKIEVLRVRDVVVVINGNRKVERVTGRNVTEILKELSVVSRGALISPAPGTRMAPGGQIMVAQSVPVTVVRDGRTQPVMTNVLTARDLLRQLGVTVGPYDRVEPGMDAYPSEGSTIKVVRVNEAIETVRSNVAFKRRTQSSSELELGIRKVSRSGREGVRESSYRNLYEDGRLKSRTFLGSKMVREPVDEITLLGTFRPSLRSATQSQTGKASWYAQPGLMAAHRSLPLGTLVRVTNLANGRQVTVTIRDRGPYVDGRVIDLSDAAFAQLSPSSRGVLNVKLEW